MVGFLLILFFIKKSMVYPDPIFAKDSDGTPSIQILENMKTGFETVSLKTYPFGYLEVQGWEKVGFPKDLEVEIFWKIQEDLGAGNIYIGYSWGGDYKEIGPFEGISNSTSFNIPVNIFSDIRNLKLRFRGEDLDLASEAIAEVKIKLKVVKYSFGI